MSVQPAALELLTALSTVLARWGRWYVFDAQAVIAYGVPRLSADVDVTVALGPDEPERFVRDMEVSGFALRVDDPDFVRRTRVLPFVHLRTTMPLDVVLAGSGLEDEFLDRAREVVIGGTTVPLIDREDFSSPRFSRAAPKTSATRRASGAFTGGPWTPIAFGGHYGCSRTLSVRATFFPPSNRSSMRADRASFLERRGLSGTTTGLAPRACE